VRPPPPEVERETFSRNGVADVMGRLSDIDREADRALQFLFAGGISMLFTLALILLIAWALGLGGVYAIGSIVHVLLVIAIVLFLVGLISGRETVV
jgi:uncharacterized membrane protein YtjA (UPF0391 family)